MISIKVNLVMTMKSRSETQYDTPTNGIHLIRILPGTSIASNARMNVRMDGQTAGHTG